MQGIFEKLIIALPKLKTKIQLTGLIVTIVAFIIIQITTPGNINAMITAFTGGAMLIFFGNLPTILPLFPERDRLKAFIYIFILYSVLMFALAATATYFVIHYSQSKESLFLQKEENLSSVSAMNDKNDKESQNLLPNNDDRETETKSTSENVSPNRDEIEDSTMNSNNHHRKQDRLKIPQVTKAIVVAGGGPYQGNHLWEAILINANFAYRCLQYNGLTKNSIYYLASNTNLDLDNNGVSDDVDGDSTIDNLKYAITEWAKDSDRLIIYLVDHGTHEKFKMSNSEVLHATMLDTWLDSLQTDFDNEVISIYDASFSGSFIKPLVPPIKKERIIITSSSINENAYFLQKGEYSFSGLFWKQIFNGLDIKNAFDMAVDAMKQFQHPLLDADGDGVSNEPEDFKLCEGVFIGLTKRSSGFSESPLRFDSENRL